MVVLASSSPALHQQLLLVGPLRLHSTQCHKRQHELEPSRATDTAERPPLRTWSILGDDQHSEVVERGMRRRIGPVLSVATRDPGWQKTATHLAVEFSK